jgi:hypothetical protein
VTLVAPGLLPTTVSVEVAGGEERKLEQALGRFDDDPVPLFERTRASIGELVVSNATRDLGRRVQADLLLLASVAEQGETVRLSAYLYDLRTGKLARQATRVAPAADLERMAGVLAQEIDAGRVAANPAFEKDAAPKRPNIVWRAGKRWRNWKYFWHSVAVIGGVALTSVIVGIAVSSQDQGLDLRYPGVILTGRGPGFSF